MVIKLNIMIGIFMMKIYSSNGNIRFADGRIVIIWKERQIKN